MAKDFSSRTKSTQRSAATTAGWMNDFIHVSGPQANLAITPKGKFVFNNFVINTAPGGGDIILKVGSDILAVITAASNAREFKYNCYLYDQLFYSADQDCDVTFILSKG